MTERFSKYLPLSEIAAMASHHGIVSKFLVLVVEIATKADEILPLRRFANDNAILKLLFFLSFGHIESVDNVDSGGGDRLPLGAPNKEQLYTKKQYASVRDVITSLRRFPLERSTATLHDVTNIVHLTINH